MENKMHIVCPHCTAVNRLPEEKLDSKPKCGKCSRSLFGGRPVELTESTFQTHMERNDVAVVVDFWAAWCGPCKMMAPAFEKAAAQMEPGIRFAKVDTEKERSLAGRFGIQSIPTTIIFKGGRELARQPGAMDLNTLTNWIRSQLQGR